MTLLSVVMAVVQDLECERLRGVFRMAFPHLPLCSRAYLLLQYIAVAEMPRRWSR